MLALRDLNSPDLPQPAGNVCISPWISFDHRRILESKRKFVDCLAQYMFNDEQDHYNYFFDGVKYTDPQSKLEAIRKVSPLHASWENICPTLVTYGSTEVFSDDCEDFISLLQRENVQVDVITREAPHIWLISSPLAPNLEIWEEDCSRLATWCANQVSH
jgi:acetyl esterase/lipase